MSCFVGIRWILKQRNDHELSCCHMSFLLISTVLGAFYNGIALFGGKLFGLKLFSHKLSHNRSQDMENYRFINSTLFEDIPQLIIQQLYIWEFELLSNNDSSNSESNVVYIALTFTLISLTIASINQISRLCQKQRKRELKFEYVDQLSCELTIKSIDIKSYHTCAHSKIGHCLATVIDESQNVKQVRQQLDAAFQLEVHKITVGIAPNIQKAKDKDDIIIAKKTWQLNALFELTVLSNHSNEKLTQLISQTIDSISNPEQNDYDKLQQALKKFLKIKHCELNLTRITPFDCRSANIVVANLPNDNEDVAEIILVN